jgi:NADPH:quinone reductase
MKAILCRQYGPPETLSLEEVRSPLPARGQVVVQVAAAAVNFPDTLIIQNKYQFKPPLPFSPGGEVAGTVKLVGEGVTGLSPGDRVLAVCTWGGYAEEVVVPAPAVTRLPDGVGFDEAAALTLAYGTTYHALKDRAELRPGETLLVLGAAGGTGLAAVEFGRQMGARVIAAASTDEKLAVCRAAGADECINYTTEDLRERLKAITGGKGVDVVYDPVGGAYTELAVRSLGWKGRLLVIGFAAGDIPKIALNLTLLKGASIVGVFYGAFVQAEPQAAAANLQEMLRMLAAGELRPTVTERHPLSEAPRVLRAFMERRIMGKVVLVP